ncbi:hypothetical protein CTEN210_06153 [Chaetoceros tenuissimus]|uniref:Ribonuclease H n=1 Tax=Chaetoceros tenuissimus TaxID=426638 RepID=A0AAD3CPB5_9STRA|nr:hypothetical protein CTEN210_06153 [Chaetoceros tenuissimus]
MAKKFYYAVRKGRVPGIYTSWPECQKQTNGFSKPEFKKFKTEAEARQFAFPSSSQTKSAGTSSIDARKKRALPSSSMPSSAHRKRLHTTDDNTEDDGCVIEMHFDGGARNNPGCAGSGAVIQVQNTEIRLRFFVGMKATNNVAEYHGLRVGLSQIEEQLQKQSDLLDKNIVIKVFGDSNLIINHMLGIYKCKNANLKVIFDECNEIVSRIRTICKGGCTICYEHVYREQNKIADMLANEAMDKKKSWTETMQIEENKECDPREEAIELKPKLVHKSSLQNPIDLTIEEV